MSVGPPLPPLFWLLLLTVCLHCSQVGPQGATAASLLAASRPGLPFFDLEQRKQSPEPEVGISIAELLASGDRVLSVLPHDLVAEGWVQVQLGYFWKHFSFILPNLAHQPSSLNRIMAPLLRPSGISVGVGIFVRVLDSANFRMSLNRGGGDVYPGIPPQLCSATTRTPPAPRQGTLLC